MQDLGLIPDRIYIDLIREGLRIDREYGRAAVLVGAGFSGNAEKNSPAATGFASACRITS